MPRCPDCNKFVSLEEQEPEVTLDVEEGGKVTAEVKIVNACAECGVELTEAVFSLEAEVDVEGHVGPGHDLEVEGTGTERTSRQGYFKGEKFIHMGGRYGKTFYGAIVNFRVTCSCGTLGEKGQRVDEAPSENSMFPRGFFFSSWLAWGRVSLIPGGRGHVCGHVFQIGGWRMEQEECFVIAPIGEDGSDSRNRSDQIFKYIVEPAAREAGFKAVMAHQLHQPGLITKQIIERVLNAPMLIADLTDYNPNVFYELAVRHASRKPCVHLIEVGQRIPFDVGDQRMVRVTNNDLALADRARVELTEKIKEAKQQGGAYDNPISATIDLSASQQSGRGIEPMVAKLLEGLQRIETRLENEPGPKDYVDVLLDVIRPTKFTSGGAGMTSAKSTGMQSYIIPSRPTDVTPGTPIPGTRSKST